ncbi:hypothetical protein MUN82_17025 [Hymenobacter aerilatus]|uniref:Auto-transporter adhesin head GIN domain-containing protein n=1 Tax=Hymenobacter aerilatus TaxID=2932251 RepID=A0A8T9SXY7_9BACT|nr:hypothetical protein [Hymenobacter aerilatus]UOR04639.1 hypothetical protein MUN82_17025 [Hymenobacter aerilatus]
MNRIVRNRYRAGMLLMLLWLLSCLGTQAQQKVQVVTRTLEQRWIGKPNMLVRIQAEKATLRVQGWDKPTVEVVLRLSARHPDRAVAERDLAAAQYRLQENASAINLINFFSLPSGAPTVQSDLRAEYTVMMPASNPLQAANTYGQTTLAGLNGEQKLEQNFGQISLRDLRGSLSATIRYADLVATNVHADFICEANKSAVQLLGLGGSCFVRNYYGSIQVQPAAELRKLTVEADRTKVIISAAEPALFAYQLNVLQGQLVVPPAYAAAKKGAASRASLTTKPASGTQPLVRASTSYSSLILQTQLLSTQF